MIETLAQLIAFLWLVGTAIGILAGLLGAVVIVVYTIVDLVRASLRYR